MARLILQAVRDLPFLFLPKALTQKIMGKADFAFLAHPLEPIDISKKYPFLKNASERTLAFVTSNLWPVAASRIIGFKTKSGRDCMGWIVACPMTARQMVERPKIAQKKILKAARLAEKLGAEIIGLGGFSSIVTKGGTSLIGRTGIGITTGNAYAAALIIQYIDEITDRLGMDVKHMVIGIVGAAGSVGSACSTILSRKAKKLLLIDRDKKALEETVEKFEQANSRLVVSTKLSLLREADIVIGVSSATEGVIRSVHLQPGAIVIDAAQPYNVSAEVLERNDLLVVNSGAARVKGISYDVDIGLQEEEVYACLGEVLTLVWRSFKGNYNVGKVDPRLVDETLSAAQEMGMQPAGLRNPSGPVTNEDFRRIQRFIERRC